MFWLILGARNPVLNMFLMLESPSPIVFLFHLYQSHTKTKVKCNVDPSHFFMLRSQTEIS